MDPNERPPSAIEIVSPRQAEALNYRRRGYTWRQIGAMMGIAHVTAYQYAHEAIKKTQAYDKFQADEVRALELERLDQAVRIVTKAIGEPEDEKGEPTNTRLNAIDRLIDLSERRAKLLGLDIAEKLAPDEIPTDTDELNRVLRERIRSLKAAREKVTTPSEN